VEGHLLLDIELFSAQFWQALFSIVIIDVVLAGDNAVVIAMAARNLPKHQQKRTIFWGIFGAIAIRTVLTIAAVQLLKITGLHLVGGLLLLWIAYQLLVEDKGHDGAEGSQAKTFEEALRTILIADTVMSLDNVLAIAGASHGSTFMVILGLLISVPVILFGSTVILRLLERFPIIIYAGAGILVWTAAKMIVGEKFVEPYFENAVLRYIFEISLIIFVLAIGYVVKRGKSRKSSGADA
jgi:YjbE family integral membrane protein